jgi:hypothetical protein
MVLIAVSIPLLLVCTGEDAFGQTPYEVRLQSRTFIPPADVDAFLLSGKSRGVIQFYQIPTETQHRSIEGAGIILHDYLPYFAYTTTIDPDLTPRELRNLGVRALFSFEENDKLSPVITEGEIGEWAKPEPGRVVLTVLYYPDFPNDSAQDILRSLRAEVLFSSEFFESITISIDSVMINEVAEFDWVRWIEPLLPPPEEENDGSRASINVDLVQGPPFNLSGWRVNIGQWEPGVPFNHDDFSGRLTVVEEGAPVKEHATHVAGTMAGDGTRSDGQYKGMAPRSRIFSWSTDDNDIFTVEVPMEMLKGVDGLDPQGDPIDEPIVISQNSWGHPIGGFNNCVAFGRYESVSGYNDQLVRFKNLHIFYSAGNERNSPTANKCAEKGEIPGGGYGTFNAPHTAKNIVAVGNVDKNDNIDDASNWGPTADGRLKPDVVAVGVDVTSTGLDNTYFSEDGTSMSCPAVSGTGALLIERYRQEPYVIDSTATPPPALIKAILLNTATDLGNPGPDFQFGYGKVNALKAVEALDKQAWRGGIVSQGETRTHKFNVKKQKGPPSCSIKVLLCYSDKDAAENAEPALVNDLDLKLIDPMDNVYLPLTLDPSPGHEEDEATPEENHRDNVEQVIVGPFGNNLAGIWTIQVEGTVVYKGSQAYYVTWQEEGCILGGGVDLIQTIIDDVNKLVDERVLNQGQGNSLITKLEASIQQLDRGNITAAINQLHAFINQVSAFIRKGILSREQGQPLIDAANEVIHEISGVDPQSGDKESMIPYQTLLYQNTPNPFAQLTAISYQLRATSHTTLKVYNLMGRLVRTLVDGEKDAGYHTLNWDRKDNRGQEISNGIYFYRLQISQTPFTKGGKGDFTETRKMILLK